MSVIISATSGLWADGTTWVGGVAPIATDDIIIAAGHTVTVAVSPAPLEKTLDIYGTLQLNETLQSGVNTATSMCTVTGHPGGNIIIAAGKNWHTGQGIYRLKGSTDNWFHVHGDGGVTYPASNSYRIQWDCEYVSFRNTGEMRIHTGNTSGNTAIVNGIDIRNSTFKSNQQYIYIGAGGLTGATAPMVFTRCDFRGSAAPAIASSGTSTLLRRFDRCTFGQIGLSSGMRVTTLGIVQMIDCTCVNAGPGKGPAASNSPYVIGGGFYAESNSTTPVILSTSHKDSIITGAILHTANVAPSNVNPHSLTILKSRNCIAETFGSEPNTFLCPTTATATDIFTVEGCLLIGNGDLANYAGTKINPASIRNNTLASHNGGKVGGMFMSENNTSAIPPELRDNLQASLAATPLDSMVRTVTGVGYIFNVDSDYNCIWNTVNFIDTETAYSGGYDTHSLRADPQFVDPTRMLVPWVKQYTGNPDATWETAYSLMLDINGYDAATGTQKPTTTPASIAKIAFDWIAAGYVPQNMALATAGEGGTYIGAFPPANEPPPPPPPPPPPDLSQTGRFKEIADAIRAKEGSTDLIAPSQFAAHILAL